MRKRLMHYCRVAGAVFLRDLKIYLRYPANVLFGLIDPFVWMIPVYFMAQAFMTGGRSPGLEAYTGTSDYIAFWLVGGIVGFYLNSVMWRMGFSLKNEMMLGVIETNWLAPVPVLVHLVGRSLWSLTHTTFMAGLMLLVARLALGVSFTGEVWSALLTMIPILIGLYGLGFGIAAAVLLSNDANFIIDTSSFLVRTLSGHQFPVNVLPPALMAVSLAIPLTYGLDAVRGYLLGTKTLLPLAQEQVVMLVVAVLFTGAGYWVLRRVERYVRLRGNLGHF